METELSSKAFVARSTDACSLPLTRKGMDVESMFCYCNLATFDHEIAGAHGIEANDRVIMDCTFFG